MGVKLLLAILLVIGIVVSLVYGIINNPPKIQACENLQTMERDLCYTNEAVYSGDKRLCKNIGEDMRDGCYFTLYISTGDKSLCNEIKSELLACEN